MHDVAVRVLAGKRRRQPLGREGEIAHRVVLDEERARGADRGEHVGAPVRGEHRAVRVGDRRLQVDELRARRRERAGQEVGPDAVGVARHRHGHEVRRARRGEGAEVGRRLDDHRAARRSQAAEARGQRRLAAVGDDHVLGGVPAAEPRRQQRAQRRQALGRHRRPGPRPARRAAERLDERPARLQVLRQVAERERERPGRHQPEEVLERARLERAGAQRHRLPPVVGRRRRRSGGSARHERPAAGPRLDESAANQVVHGPLHGRGAGAVPAHEVAHRGEPVAGSPGGDDRLELFHNRRRRVTVKHEQGG